MSWRGGQVLVEFALVLPLAIVLVLAFADFGRAYAAGSALDSAARDAARDAAQAYAQSVHGGATLTGADYRRLHQIALDTLCSQAGMLPNHAANGTACSSPASAVCIHDDRDPLCGVEAGTADPRCTALKSSWNPAARHSASGSFAAVYVEIRTCYRFTTLVHLDHLSLPFGWGLGFGDFYLQREHQFSVAGY